MATAAVTNHEDNIQVGAGHLYVDLLDADGGTQGERYLGDAAGMSLNGTETRLTVFSGSGAVARKLYDKVTERAFAGTITLRDIAVANLILLLQGEAGDYTDGSSAVNDEPITVRPGLHYQLGVTAAAPMGVRGITPKAANPVKVGNSNLAASNYEFDSAAGRIYIKPNAAGIDAAGTAIKVSYTPKAEKHHIARTAAEAKALLAAVRYIEDPAGGGGGRNLYVRRASVGSQGEFALLNQRQSEQQIPLTFGVESHPGHPLVIIDGAAA